MAVLTNLHGCNIPFISNGEFLGMCDAPVEHKRLLAGWLEKSSANLNARNLFASFQYKSKLYPLIDSYELAEELLKLKVILLPWSSKEFDLASLTSGWDFSSAVYSVLHRRYPLQVIVPGTGGRPILAVDVDRVTTLKGISADHPMHLSRLLAHEIVHLKDISSGKLYSLGGKIYYNQKIVRHDGNPVSVLDKVAAEIGLPHEHPAYIAQLKGLDVDCSNPFSMAQHLIDNPIPLMEHG